MIVVPSHAAESRLKEAHVVRPGKVVVIPHGAVANFNGPIDTSVPRPMILTWGLLGPGKGIEHGIHALSLMKDLLPAAHYVVAGATHPKVLEARGEEYREMLSSIAVSLGVSARVHLDDGYRDWDALRELVRSSDVVLLPYDTRDQVSSGVLVEALASGKPIVATRFPQSVELLTAGAGIVVGQGDAAAMAQGLESIIYHPERAREMGAKSRLEGEKLLWEEVGKMYRRVLEAVVHLHVA
jgi:glycosyltransferase involved in cell wall biosynthesis